MLIAVAVIRVSQPKGREGESFSSPQDQLDRIEALCSDHGWALPKENVYYEMKVSGNAPLEERTGLNPAVTKILTGAAHILVGAFSERLWWSLEVREQVLRLITDAGGEVWADDAGKLSGGSAAEDFSGEVRTSADRFSRRQNAEKARKAVERAVARGVCPFPDVPPGLQLDDDNKVVADADLPVATRAFELRRDGATIKVVRSFLTDNGIERSYHGVQAMLANRLYVGEIHFGSLQNLSAHPAYIDPVLFEAVRGMKAARGPRPKSERLLARQGILRCGTCGARLVTGHRTEDGGRKRFDFYRCNPTSDCPRRVTFSADMAEAAIVAATKKRLKEVQGRASALSEAQAAVAEADRDQDALDAAIRAFSALGDEPVALERLTALRDARDASRARADQLSGLEAARVVDIDDWDRFTLAEKRAAIRLTIARADVAPGRGSDRLTIRFFGE